MIRVLSAALLAACMFAAGTTTGQTPRPTPTPRPVPSNSLPQPQEIPLVPIVTSFRIVDGPTRGKRNVWELYSVNSRGQFVPRVVMDPEGYYYLKDGRPYPWATFGSGSYMPNAVD